MTHPNRPRGIGDLIGDAREVIDGQWGDDRDAPRLHTILDTAEDYYLAHDAWTAADYLRAVARMDDDPGVQDVLRDLADGIEQ